MIIWIILGIIFCTITAVIHCNTYYTDCHYKIDREFRVTMPMFLAIAIGISFFIPILSIFIFIIGIILYLDALTQGEIDIDIESFRLFKFLSKRV